METITVVNLDTFKKPMSGTAFYNIVKTLDFSVIELYWDNFTNIQKDICNRQIHIPLTFIEKKWDSFTSYQKNILIKYKKLDFVFIEQHS